MVSAGVPFTGCQVDDNKLNYHLDNSRISWGLDKNYSSIDINFESENLGLFYE